MTYDKMVIKTGCLYKNNQPVLAKIYKTVTVTLFYNVFSTTLHQHSSFIIIRTY